MVENKPPHESKPSCVTEPTAITTIARSIEMDSSNRKGDGTQETSTTIDATGSDTFIEKPTGLAMYILFAAVFSSGFLMALNGSMVATVSF